MHNSAKVEVVILSLNVRGIRDQIKRKSIFSYLKDQKANIYFLQETYSCTNLLDLMNDITVLAIGLRELQLIIMVKNPKSKMEYIKRSL